MNEELGKRIRRIYADMGETEEKDLSKFRPQIVETSGFVLVEQDFRRGKS